MQGCSALAFQGHGRDMGHELVLLSGADHWKSL